MARKNLAQANEESLLDNMSHIVTTNKDLNLTKNMPKQDFANDMLGLMGLGDASTYNVGVANGLIPVFGNIGGQGIMVTSGNNITTYPELTAFNKNFIGSGGSYGSANNVARGDHSHAFFDSASFRYETIITGVGSLAISSATFISSLGETINTISPGVTVSLYEKVGSSWYPISNPSITVDETIDSVTGGANHILDGLTIFTLTTTKSYMVSVSFRQGHIFVIDGGSPT